MTSVIVMQQPAMAPQFVPVIQQPREWSSSQCDCCDDCSGCWYVIFCTACFMCSFSTRMNENCFAMFVAPVAMRTKLRTENNIQGSVCDDYCSMGCCSQMVYCQMDRELKHLGR